MVFMHNPYTNVTIQSTYKFIQRWRKLGFFVLRQVLYWDYKTRL